MFRRWVKSDPLTLGWWYRSAGWRGWWLRWVWWRGCWLRRRIGRCGLCCAGLYRFVAMVGVSAAAYYDGCARFVYLQVLLVDVCCLQAVDRDAVGLAVDVDLVVLCTFL